MVACAKCRCEKEVKATASGGIRLPRGWKNHDGYWCIECWRKSYVLRAITIPIVRPLGEGIGWPQLRESLNHGWRDMTALYNWLVRELYVRDNDNPNGTSRKKRSQRYICIPRRPRDFQVFQVASWPALRIG